MYSGGPWYQLVSAFLDRSQSVSINCSGYLLISDTMEADPIFETMHTQWTMPNITFV
jgi:hypothetical protein